MHLLIHQYINIYFAMSILLTTKLLQFIRLTHYVRKPSYDLLPKKLKPPYLHLLKIHMKVSPLKFCHLQ